MVNAIDYEGAVSRIMAAASERRALAVSALAVHGVMTGALDRSHLFRLNAFDLIVPDGQPVRWALRFLHGIRLPDRVAGPDLSVKILDRAEAEGRSIFLFGSSKDVLEALLAALRKRHPRLLVAGYEPSSFRTLSAQEDRLLDERIIASGADIVFVGLGCPRQEVFVYEHAKAISRPMLAVGAAFDFHAGFRRRAPKWMQTFGLEWLTRLAAEPGRLWKRYLLLSPLYVALILAQRLGLFSPSSIAGPPEPIRYG